MGDAMTRLIVTNKTTSFMNHVPPFKEIEFSDEDSLGGILVTVTLRDGSKQYGIFANLASPISYFGSSTDLRRARGATAKNMNGSEAS